MGQQIVFSNSVAEELTKLAAGAVGTVILTDSNVERAVVDRLNLPHNWLVLAFEAGEGNKSIATAERLWERLVEVGATRRWVVLNIGGGVVTDLGGFVASTFKRGLRFVNVPTTLLAAVDAAVGGKTGVNFRGLKNEIGVFSEAEAVVVSSVFFDTLSREELLSGYGEVLKHALLQGREATLAAVAETPSEIGAERMLRLLKDSVDVKRRIVDVDPRETGLRKALNLGHTVAHAIESVELAKGRSVPHGYAVAWGLVADLVLSHMKLAFPSDVLHIVAQYVKENYPAPPIMCDDYGLLLERMRHDKKNADSGHINFTLLREPGDAVVDCTAEAKEIEAALDIMRDLLSV